MLTKDNRNKILELFFDSPTISGGFGLREISRLVNIAPKSVKLYLKEFEKENLIIIKKNRQSQPIYIPNRDNNYFKFLKRLNLQEKLYNSGVIDYLSMECVPKVIILFGSASIGEDTEESDIDLFLLSKQKNLKLEKYENFLKRKISILFENDFNKISGELKNNLINGTILYGYLKVF